MQLISIFRLISYSINDTINMVEQGGAYMGIEPVIKYKYAPDSKEAKRLLEDFGDPAEAVARFEKSEKLFKRLDAERKELVKIYPDQWVAMSEDGIVAAADTVNELFKLVKEKGIIYQSKRGTENRAPDSQSGARSLGTTFASWPCELSGIATHLPSSALSSTPSGPRS